MYCIHCGAQLDDAANFCPKCGKPCSKDAQPAPEAPVPEIPAPAQNQAESAGGQQQPAASQPPGGSQQPAGYQQPVIYQQSSQQQNNQQQGSYQQQYHYQQQGGYQQQNNYQQQGGYARMAPVRPVSFGDAIKLFFTQYVKFDGRATRSEYWWVFLFNFIVGLVLTVIFPPRATVYSLAVLLPSLGLHWRRMHDTGRSGAFTLLALIPFVGAIIVIVFCCFDSDGDNMYGPRKV